MHGEEIRIEGLQKVSSIIRELDRRVSEAIEASQEIGLTQVARILETVKSYIELLKREIEVEP